MTRPRVAITMGDPAGVGPEVALKALREPGLYERCRPVVFGTRAALAREAAARGLELALDPDLTRDDAGPERILVHAVSDSVEPPPYGEVSAEGGELAVAAVRAAHPRGARGPDRRPGHGAAQQGVDAAGGLRARRAHRAAGRPLRRPGGVDAARGSAAAGGAHDDPHRPRGGPEPDHGRAPGDRGGHRHRAARPAGDRAPRLAVAGLNPHAGEGGLFGEQEQRVLGPAIERLRAAGADVSGPLPGDTVFGPPAQVATTS